MKTLPPKTAQEFSRTSLRYRVLQRARPSTATSPNFVIQGGCPTGTGTGDYTDPATKRKRTIPLEVSPQLKHDAAGVVAMARSSDPNSASCQFYITLNSAAFLDMNYAVFGRVTEGLENVQKLRKGDKINSVVIA